MFHVPAVNALEESCATAPLTVSVLPFKLSRPVLLRLPATFTVALVQMRPPVLVKLPLTFRVAVFRIMPPALLRSPAVVKLRPPSKLKMLPAAMVFRLARAAKLEVAPLSVTWEPASDVMLEPLAKLRFE